MEGAKIPTAPPLPNPINPPPPPQSPALSEHPDIQAAPLINLETDVTDSGRDLDLDSESATSSAGRSRSRSRRSARITRPRRHLSQMSDVRRTIRIQRPPHYRSLQGDPPADSNSDSDSEIEDQHYQHLVRAFEPLLPLVHALYRPGLLDENLTQTLLYALTKRLKPGRLGRSARRVRKRDQRRKLADTYRDAFSKVKLQTSVEGLPEKDYQARLVALKKDHGYKKFSDKSPEFHGLLIDFADFVSHNRLSEEQAIRALLSFLLPPARDVTQNLYNAMGLKKTFRWLVDTKADRATASSREDAFFNWHPNYNQPDASLDDLYHKTVLAYPKADITAKFQEAVLGRVAQDIRAAFRKEKLAAGFSDDEILDNSLFLNLIRRLMAEYKPSRPKIHEIAAEEHVGPPVVQFPANVAAVGVEASLQKFEALLDRFVSCLETQEAKQVNVVNQVKSNGKGKRSQEPQPQGQFRAPPSSNLVDLAQLVSALNMAPNSSLMGGQPPPSLPPPIVPTPAGNPQYPKTHVLCGRERLAIVLDPQELRQAQQDFSLANLNTNMVEEGTGDYPYFRLGDYFTPLRRTVKLNGDMLHIFLKNSAGQVVLNPRVTGLFKHACAACGIIADHRMGSLRCPLQGAQSTWEPCKKCRMGFHPPSQCRVSPQYDPKN